MTIFLFSILVISIRLMAFIVHLFSQVLTFFPTAATETKSWIQPTIIGNHPIARYGHAATTVGTKMYIFGGEAEGYYMNDLLALDAASSK